MGGVVLIGMPACGKSTIGVLLAKSLGIGFVDTDLLLQQREGRLLQDIIEREGLSAFLDREMETVLSAEFGRCVVATGGSVVFRDRAMQKLREIGKVVFLDVPLPVLKERLRDIRARGVAAEPEQSVEDICRERLPFYRKYADIVLDLGGCTPKESVLKIIEALKM